MPRCSRRYRPGMQVGFESQNASQKGIFDANLVNNLQAESLNSVPALLEHRAYVSYLADRRTTGFAPQNGFVFSNSHQRRANWVRFVTGRYSRGRIGQFVWQKWRYFPTRTVDESRRRQSASI